MALAALSLLLSLSLLSLPASAVPDDELSAALSAMRLHPGYSLFANALATSDLYYSLLLADSNASFTLFAPTDPAVYSLDMSAASADDYVSALSCHVVPRRLSLSTLRSVLSGSNLPTLEPRHSIHLQTRLSDDVISVDGVPVIFPGLFYSPSLAVHGLGGIIDRPRRHSPPLPRPPPISFNQNISESPPSDNQPPPPPPISTDSSISEPPRANWATSPANSLGNLGAPAAIGSVEVSPVSSVASALAPDYVATPLKSTEKEVILTDGQRGADMLLGQVSIGRGNTFTLERQRSHTCPVDAC